MDNRKLLAGVLSFLGVFILAVCLKGVLAPVFLPLWALPAEGVLHLLPEPTSDTSLRLDYPEAKAHVRNPSFVPAGGGQDLFWLDGDILFLSLAAILALVIAGRTRPAGTWAWKAAVVLATGWISQILYMAIHVHTHLMARVPDAGWWNHEFLEWLNGFWSLVVRFWLPILVWGMLEAGTIRGWIRRSPLRGE